MLPTKKSQITHHKLFHPSFFPSNKNVSLNARDVTARTAFRDKWPTRMRFRKFWSWVVWRIIPVPNPRTPPFLRRWKHLGIFFWEVGTVKKICRSRIILNILPVKDGCFSNEIRRGGGEKMVPKTNTECTLWKVEGKRTIYFPFWGSAKFDNLDHFAEHPLHFSQRFHFHKEPPCPNKIHQATKMAGKRNEHPLRISFCFGMISGEKKGVLFEWFTPCLTRNFVLFHHTNLHHLHLSPNEKTNAWKCPQQQKIIRNNSSENSNQFHFWRSCFVFWLPTVQWKALLERSELIVFFFCESRERVEIFFSLRVFRGGWGLGVWVFRTCCLLTLKHWMTYNIYI